MGRESKASLRQVLCGGQNVAGKLSRRSVAVSSEIVLSLPEPRFRRKLSIVTHSRLTPVAPLRPPVTVLRTRLQFPARLGLAGWDIGSFILETRLFL